ncbi:MAG TPA: hypothetical protein VFA38_05730 [Nitrospirales bacterium]|nr:hypothetical protein [Nitrospirales bacterium]
MLHRRLLRNAIIELIQPLALRLLLLVDFLEPIFLQLDICVEAIQVRIALVGFALIRALKAGSTGCAREEEGADCQKRRKPKSEIHIEPPLIIEAIR